MFINVFLFCICLSKVKVFTSSTNKTSRKKNKIKMVEDNEYFDVGKNLHVFYNEQIIDETRIYIVPKSNNGIISVLSVILLQVCLLLKPVKFKVIKRSL